MDDLVDLLAPAVVAAQDGPVLVGHLGPGGDDLAHQGAEAAHVLLGEGPVVRVGEVAVEQGAQVGVERGTSRDRWPARTRRSRGASPDATAAGAGVPGPALAARTTAGAIT